MAFYILEAATDSAENIWAVGRDLSLFNGQDWEYFNSSNSVVPDNSPYYMDTRTISIDEYDVKWVGCAIAPSTSQVLVFSVDNTDAATGSNWTLSDFNLPPGGLWEVGEIYASPYGDEVLAYITDLNGGAGTGATCTPGITGGYLWRYNKVLQEWSEVAPGYIWPTIYEIAAKGLDGVNWEYYLATSDGLQIIPPGTLDYEVLQDGTFFLPGLKKLNPYNSSIPSSQVYSISFDENGNYWLGTDSGLTYWDGEKFYNWTVPLNNSVTEVTSRPYGHVFFRCGDPFFDLSLSDGFFHFNGDNFSQFNTGNSALPSDRVINLLLVRNKVEKNGLSVYPNDLWVVNGNNVTLFDYNLPHVYASSNYTGTTGWNFIYYTPGSTGATTDAANLPKTQRYDWVYPSWQGYDNQKIVLNHPGMDPRSLFLTTNFKDLANGQAENQDYWNWGSVPTYDQSLTAGRIPSSDWVVGITGSSSPFLTQPSISLTATTRYSHLNVVGGFMIGENAYLGASSNTEDFVLQNTNDTSFFPGNEFMGFLAFYTDGGQVQGAIPFRGANTKILDVKRSFDGKTIYALGIYNYFLEAGKFTWGSSYPTAGGMSVTGVTGPTGGPIGFSNMASPGATSDYSYPWILNAPTSATSGLYIPDFSVVNDTTAFFIAEIDYEIGNQISYGGIDFSSETASEVFCLKKFRYFPGASSDYDTQTGGPTGYFPSGVDYPGAASLAVGENSIRIMGNIQGGFATLARDYENILDAPSCPSFFFSSISGGSYTNSSFVLELNEDFSLRGVQTIGMTGPNSYTDTISTVPNAQTFLLSGTSTSDVSYGNLNLTHPNPGFCFPWILLSLPSFTGITGSFISNHTSNGSSFPSWRPTIGTFSSDSSYYAGFIYTGDAVITAGSTSLTFAGASGALSAGLLSISPGGIVRQESSYEILPSSYQAVDSSFLSGVQGLSTGDSYYLSVFYPTVPGVTGGGNHIFKRSISGTYVDEFSTVSLDSSTVQSPLVFSVYPNLDLFLAGSVTGQTGPTGLPYPPLDGFPFVAFSESYKAPKGIDLGNIISRAGSGAWTWADVHNSERDLYVPMLSTVFFSNYGSQIFGKQNNRWVLTDARNGNVILDVKFTPYFIYTFTSSGYYSLQNTVEDAAGNIYEISKPAFIKVVNQSIPRADDPNPLLVNSADYGYIKPSKELQNQIWELNQDLLEEQIVIRRESAIPFGSGLVIKSDANSTFRET